MFFRLEKSGDRAYVQIVENKRFVGAVRQSVVARFGRADEIEASGAVRRCWPRAPSSPIRSCSYQRATKTREARRPRRLNSSAARAIDQASARGQTAARKLCQTPEPR